MTKNVSFVINVSIFLKFVFDVNKLSETKQPEGLPDGIIKPYERKTV